MLPTGPSNVGGLGAHGSRIIAMRWRRTCGAASIARCPRPRRDRARWGHIRQGGLHWSGWGSSTSKRQCHYDRQNAQIPHMRSVCVAASRRRRDHGYEHTWSRIAAPSRGPRRDMTVDRPGAIARVGCLTIALRELQGLPALSPVLGITRSHGAPIYSGGSTWEDEWIWSVSSRRCGVRNC